MKIVATFLSLILFYTENYAQSIHHLIQKANRFMQKQSIDSDAVYFTPENFNIKADGSMDICDVCTGATFTGL